MTDDSPDPTTKMLVISPSTSQTFEVGQVPAEDPTYGETSIEQQLLWVEGEVVSEVLAGQVPHLDCALYAPFSQDYPAGRAWQEFAAPEQR